MYSNLLVALEWIYACMVLLVSLTYYTRFTSYLFWAGLITLLATDNVQITLVVFGLSAAFSLYAAVLNATHCEECHQRLGPYLRHPEDGLVRKCTNPGCGIKYYPRAYIYAQLPFWSRLLPSYRN